MLVMLSPAKSLDMESDRSVGNGSMPHFADKANQLVTIMRNKSVGDIMRLMKISDKLAELNYDRYQRFSPEYDVENTRQAILAFTGDVYRGFDAATLSDEQLMYANDHVRILSGLYGMLKPLDVMQPYRLEMGTALPNGKGSNLYDFWQSDITDELNASGETVVNLASKEYSQAIDFKKLEVPFVHVHFKEKKEDQYRVVGIFAKKARGLMARYVVKQHIDTLEGLKAFNDEGYALNASLSDGKNFVFTRG